MERLTDKSTYSNFTEVFATHLHMDVELDFSRKVLFGAVTHTLDVEAGISTKKYIVDTRKVTILAVTVDGVAQKYSFGETSDAFGSALIIEFANDIKKGQKVTINYETAPGQECPGALFLEPSQTANGTHPFYFTQGQAILARSIVPCQDTPARKVTYSATVIVPEDMTAVMSATSIGKPETIQEGETTPVIRKKRFSFDQKTCIPTYLITIAAGLIERRDISDRCAVWAEPSLAKKAAWEFEDVEKYLTTAENLCGKYVWGRYDIIVLPPAFPYGGMENPQLTFVTPTLLTGDKSKVNVVIHEIAHSWSGNLVTNATWEDFWLNEGFTVYTERAVLHEIEGKDAFNVHAELGWRDLVATCCEEFTPDHEFTKLRPCLCGIDPDEAFSKIPYEKGFALLLNLQQQLYGVDAPPTSLYPFLRFWFDKWAYKTVDFNDLLATLKEFYAKDTQKLAVVNDFDFASWVTKPGVPSPKPVIDPKPVEGVIAMAEKTAQDPNLLSKLSREELNLIALPTLKGGLSPDLKLLYLVTLRQMQTESGRFNKYLHRTVVRKPANIAELAAQAAAEGKTSIKLEDCQTELLPHPCKTLDDNFGFSATTDPDVKHEWIMLCIQLDYLPVKDLTFDFLGAQGRIKYVKPTFQRLWKASAQFRNLAREAFHAHINKYHAVLARMVAEIVGMEIAQARGYSNLYGPNAAAAGQNLSLGSIKTFGLKDVAAPLPALSPALKNKLKAQDLGHEIDPVRADAREAALRLIMAAHPGMDFENMTPVGICVKIGADGRPQVLPDQPNAIAPSSFKPVFPPNFPVPEEAKANGAVIINFGTPSQVEFGANEDEQQQQA